MYKINTLIFLSGGINVADNELEKVLIEIDKHHKSLETKYNVLVKRTNSMIKSLSIIDDKLDFLLDKMSMFEFIEEAGEEDEGERADFVVRCNIGVGLSFFVTSHLA